MTDDADSRFTIDEMTGTITVATSLSVTDQNRKFTIIARATDAGLEIGICCCLLWHFEHIYYNHLPSFPNPCGDFRNYLIFYSFKCEVLKRGRCQQPTLLYDCTTFSNISSEILGENPQFSEIHVVIRVMNEATPIFDERFRVVSIPENLALHSVVTTIEAQSPTGQKIIYSIFEGDVYGEFAVDFVTGDFLNHNLKFLLFEFAFVIFITICRTHTYILIFEVEVFYKHGQSLENNNVINTNGVFDQKSIYLLF